KVVLFDVQSSSAQVRQAQRVVYGFAVLLLYEGAFARLPHSVRDHVHRSLERNLFPRPRIRPAVFHAAEASGMCVKLKCVRTFGTEPPTRHRRGWIAFDGHQLTLSMEHQLSATNSAIGTD